MWPKTFFLIFFKINKTTWRNEKWKQCCVCSLPSNNSIPSMILIVFSTITCLLQVSPWNGHCVCVTITWHSSLCSPRSSQAQSPGSQSTGVFYQEDFRIPLQPWDIDRWLATSATTTPKTKEKDGNISLDINGVSHEAVNTSRVSQRVILSSYIRIPKAAYWNSRLQDPALEIIWVLSGCQAGLRQGWN